MRKTGRNSRKLTALVEQEAKKRPEVVQLMTHPGVGPITGLAYVLIIGTPERFPCGKQVGSYTGLIPCEDSSAAGNGWDISANKGTLYCVFCWWKQRRQPDGVTRTGGVGICT